MASDESTLTVGPLDTLTGGSGLPLVPALTVILHPHLDRIGHIAPLTNLLELDVAHVSRSEPIFFPPGADAGEPLAHSFISKNPILDVVFTRGTFELRRVQDYRVEVDGRPLDSPRRVSAADLQRGLIITLAKRVVLCLHSVHFPIARSPALGLLGTSDAIEDVRRAVTRLAPQDGPVLLRGESGSGKELAARALHTASPRAKHRFVAVNMNTLGGERATADLFGHKKGAFTGAIGDSPGYFRSAAGGTIFLDEIGNTTADVQPKLLRVLDDGVVQPVGDTQAIKVDARIVAATDAKLEQAVADKRFERPLYFRLKAAYSINLPPLRTRREDIGVLLLHLLNTALIENKISDHSILQRFQDPDPKVRPWLAARDVAAVAASPLPANGRSLLNLARKLALTISDGPLANTHAIVGEFLESDVDPAADLETSGAFDGSETQTPVRCTEGRLLEALERSGWSRSKAAELLGIGRRTLYNWLETFPQLRSVLAVPEPELHRRLKDLDGDIQKLAAQLGTTPALLNRRLGRKI